LAGWLYSVCARYFSSSISGFLFSRSFFLKAAPLHDRKMPESPSLLLFDSCASPPVVLLHRSQWRQRGSENPQYQPGIITIPPLSPCPPEPQRGPPFDSPVNCVSKPALFFEPLPTSRAPPHLSTC